MVGMLNHVMSESTQESTSIYISKFERPRELWIHHLYIIDLMITGWNCWLITGRQLSMASCDMASARTYYSLTITVFGALWTRRLCDLIEFVNAK